MKTLDQLQQELALHVERLAQKQAEVSDEQIVLGHIRRQIRILLSPDKHVVNQE